MTARPPIPATILTGFLGAGKTTLLNFILSQQHGFKFGIVVNEFGDIGIDDQLIETRDEEIVLMKNGCICCTVRKDLVGGIQQLLARGQFDYLLIETTGVADPGPIMQTFFNVPELSPYVRLDSIVTVVDAEQIDSHMTHSKVCASQIAMADFVILNKVDLVSEPQLQRVELGIRQLNRNATIFRSDHCGVDLGGLLDMHAFDLRCVGAQFQYQAQGSAHGEEGIASESFKIRGLFDAYRFQAFIEALSAEQIVLRSKGILAIAGSPRRAVFHGVNNRFTIFWDRYWQTGETRESQFVFIGKGLVREALQRRLARCVLTEYGCAAEVAAANAVD